MPPFPGVNAGKWQVSAAGGTSPVWARSGRELFFIDGNSDLVSQAVLPGATFTRGAQQALFSVAEYRLVPNYRAFDVAPDDRRFLMLRPKVGAVAGTRMLVLVENWLDEVRGRMKDR